MELQIAQRERGVGSLARSEWGSRLLGNRLPILAYHRISDDPHDPLAVPPESFAAQVGWLRRAGFQALPLDTALQRLDQGQPLRRAVTITFDDGYADLLEHAAPVLDASGFSATVFLVTGKLGRESDWHRSSRPGRLMSAEQARELRRRGYTLGSHTVSHAMLPALDTPAVERELRESRAFLISELGASDPPFAYPYGGFSARERLAVMNAGYTSACAVGGFWGNGYRSDRFGLHRFQIERRHTLRDFRAIVAAIIRLPLVIWPWQRRA